ncbi:hypothetical protein Tco_0407249 [Tanacetum coccineum]
MSENQINAGNDYWNEIRVNAGTIKVNAAREGIRLLLSNTTSQCYVNAVKTVNREVQIQALVDKNKGKDYFGRDTPLFPTMIVQAQEQSRRKQRKDTKDPQLSGPTEPITNDTKNVASVPTHSNDPLLSGEDRLKLIELIELCTSLSQRVLNLEKIKTSQAAEITELKKRVKKLEGKRKSKPPRLKRLFKIGRSAQVVSSKDKGLGAREDASKHGRKIAAIDADAEDVVEKEVSIAEVTTNSTTTTTVDELTLAQTLIKIKAAKPKAVTTAATTTITAVTRPKARGVIVQEPSEFTTTTTSPSQPSQLTHDKDKGKTKIGEPEKPLKKKDQIMFDKEVAQKLQAQLDVELEEEEKLARQREEDANFDEWDHVQAIMDADYELATRLQAEEQGELTIEEKSRLFVELINKRKKHFARLRAEEQRRKPPTKAQKRNTMSIYLKNMAGYKHNQLKTKSFNDIQMLFDKEMKRKQKLDENVEAEVDDEAEMKKYMKIVPDDEVAIDAIPLATKPPVLMLQNINREDLETLWKLVKAKHGSTRLEEGYERVLWGDRKVMFEPDVESDVWRNLQGHKVTVWKLFSSSGVHFVRF